MNVTPRHREAFPSLNVTEAMAAVAAGRPVCNYTDESGSYVGQTFFIRRVVQDSGNELLLFGYSFFSRYTKAEF